MLPRFATALLLLAVSAFPTLAQVDPADRVAVFSDWEVYVANTSAGRVCFAVSQPIDTDPTNVNRDAIYFMLANWPSRGVVNEASVITGYTYLAGSTVSVSIDADETFQFFTIDDGAWLNNLDQEAAMVVAMQRGLQMTIVGTSQFNTVTTDEYSLRGVTAAINRAASECQ